MLLISSVVMGPNRGGGFGRKLYTRFGQPLVKGDQSWIYDWTYDDLGLMITLMAAPRRWKGYKQVRTPDFGQSNVELRKHWVTIRPLKTTDLFVVQHTPRRVRQWRLHSVYSWRRSYDEEGSLETPGLLRRLAPAILLWLAYGRFLAEARSAHHNGHDLPASSLAHIQARLTRPKRALKAPPQP